MAKEYYDKAILETLTEQPIRAQVGDNEIAFYPLTLGKMLLLQPLISKLPIGKGTIIDFLRVTETNKEECARILSIYAIKGKDILENQERLTKIFNDIDNNDMASLLSALFAQPTHKMLRKKLGIEKELDRMRKVERVKDCKNTYIFGGISIYGALIDRACERYGWTLDYVLWGISADNLQLLLADAITTVYLTDKERKQIHISNDRYRINGDNKEAMETFVKSLG